MPRDTKRDNVILQRIGQAGQVKTIIDRKPEEWGDFPALPVRARSTSAR